LAQKSFSIEINQEFQCGLTVELNLSRNQRSRVTVTVGWSVNASVVFRLSRMAHIKGKLPNSRIWHIDQCGDVLPLSWANLTLTAEGGESPGVYSYSLDGRFDIWVESGIFLLRAEIPAYTEYPTLEVKVAASWDAEAELLIVFEYCKPASQSPTEATQPIHTRRFLLVDWKRILNISKVTREAARYPCQPLARDEIRAIEFPSHPAATLSCLRVPLMSLLSKSTSLYEESHPQFRDVSSELRFFNRVERIHQ